MSNVFLLYPHLILTALMANAAAGQACPDQFSRWPYDNNILEVIWHCSSTELYFPPNHSPEWATLDPIDLCWSTQHLPALFDFLEQNNTRAFILLVDGRIVIERYWGLNFGGQPFDESSLWYWASAGKTLTASLVGIAQDLGHLDLQDPTTDYLGPGWSSLTFEQETAIRVWHQLTMTTGLDDGVVDNHCTEPACLTYLEEPGLRWAYHNAPYTLLDRVLESATGQAYSIFFNQALRDPIGMDGIWLDQDYNHVYYSTPRSMARFGLLILNEGYWQDQPILADSDYFSAMVSPSQDLNPAYGYLWWLNGQESFMIPNWQFVFQGPIAPQAPEDMFAAMGKNGQFLNIVPSQRLIMVRLGEHPDDTQVPMVFQNEIWEHLNLIMSP